jgi:hypothetical protein
MSKYMWIPTSASALTLSAVGCSFNVKRAETVEDAVEDASGRQWDAERRSACEAAMATNLVQACCFDQNRHKEGRSLCVGKCATMGAQPHSTARSEARRRLRREVMTTLAKPGIHGKRGAVHMRQKLKARRHACIASLGFPRVTSGWRGGRQSYHWRSIIWSHWATR